MRFFALSSSGPSRGWFHRVCEIFEVKSESSECTIYARLTVSTGTFVDPRQLPELPGDICEFGAPGQPHSCSNSGSGPTIAALQLHDQCSSASAPDLADYMQLQLNSNGVNFNFLAGLGDFGLLVIFLVSSRPHLAGI